MRTKFLGLLLAALLVLGFAGQAMAAFSSDSMIRTYYDTGSNAIETATNLNQALTGPYNPGVIGDVLLASSLPSFSTAKVTYWGYSGDYTAGTDKYWVTGPGNASGSTLTGGRSQAISDAINLAGAVGIIPNYNGGVSGVVNVTANTITIGRGDGYYGNSDGGGSAQGSFFSSINPNGSASISLAALATTGYVDTTLWYFNYNNSGSNVAGVKAATLRTYRADANGAENFTGGLYVATEILPAAVPIPGAVWLLGSGLLGLIGIRRRKSA